MKRGLRESVTIKGVLSHETDYPPGSLYILPNNDFFRDAMRALRCHDTIPVSSQILKFFFHLLIHALRGLIAEDEY